MAEDIEGVDYELRTVEKKDGGTAYKNRHYFTKAEKAARKAAKEAPAPKAGPKAKAEPKPKTSSLRPKAKPGPMNNEAVRPVGKAAGMPAAKEKKPVVDAGTAAAGAAATTAAHAARVAGNIVSGGRKPPTPKTGTAVTTPKPAPVSRPGAGGGRGGGSALRKISPGGGRLNKYEYPLIMAKGGLVKKDK